MLCAKYVICTYFARWDNVLFLKSVSKKKIFTFLFVNSNEKETKGATKWTRVQNFGFKIVFGGEIGLKNLTWKQFLILILSHPLPFGNPSPLQSVSVIYMFSIQRGEILGGMFFYFLIKKDMSLFGCVDVWINLRRCDECRIAVGEMLRLRRRGLLLPKNV